MPQLNPSPWLAIFLLTWVVLLTILPPKVLAHCYPNAPTVQGVEIPKTESWDWTCP